MLTCWPQDAGPFITLPLVFPKEPEEREVFRQASMPARDKFVVDDREGGAGPVR